MWSAIKPSSNTAAAQPATPLMNSTAVTSGSDLANSTSLDVSMAAASGGVPEPKISAINPPDLSAVRKTPVRGETAHGRSAGSGSTFHTPSGGGGGGGSRNFLLRKAASSCLGTTGSHPRTPKSGPRVNPFDSQISHDTLHLPTFSPSVFSTVLSPSQESQSSSGRFWSVDQQAMLFPAQISEDSPWKQENATSRLDPETENRTQEAIDLYFSQHAHKATSPENGAHEATGVNDRSAVIPMEESVLGGSPDLSRPRLSRSHSCVAAASSASPHPKQAHKRPSSATAEGTACSNNVTLASIQSDTSCSERVHAKCSRWTQTILSLPPLLPPEVEAVLATHMTFNHNQENCSPVLAGNCTNLGLQSAAAPGAAVKQQLNMKSFSRIPFLSAAAAAAHQDSDVENVSTSSLRRKLFEGGDFMDDDDDNDDELDDESDSEKENEEEENEEEAVSSPPGGPLVGISPGALMLTPKTTAGPNTMAPFNSPGLGTWSVSPVTRKQRKPTSPVACSAQAVAACSPTQRLQQSQTRDDCSNLPSPRIAVAAATSVGQDLVGPPKECSTPTKN